MQACVPQLHQGTLNLETNTEGVCLFHGKTSRNNYYIGGKPRYNE